MTPAGNAALEQLNVAFRQWIIGNLHDVDTSDSAAVDAVRRR